MAWPQPSAFANEAPPGRRREEDLPDPLSTDRGISGHVVAAALGHESFATTTQSYAKVEAVTAAKQRRTISVLTGDDTIANANGKGR